MLLGGCRLVTESGTRERVSIRIADDRIADVVEEEMPAPLPTEERVDLAGRTVVPGFVDIHVHGGGGSTFTDGDAEAVAQACRFHRMNGTTRNLASLVTAPPEVLLRALASLADLTASGVVTGIHLEGPFLSPQYCGAQDPRYLRAPDGRLLAQLLDAGRGAVRMVTVAPELPGGIDLIGEIRRAGVIAAIGHSGATYAEACAAIDAGATVATHLWDAMRPLHHRQPGIVGAALARPEIACELIADGHHVHPLVVALTNQLAGDRLVFVTDAISAAGQPDGTYRLGEIAIAVKDGRSFLAGTNTIAGSTLTLAEGVRFAACEAGIPLDQAVRAAASTPARLLGMANEVGTIAPGYVADLVVLDSDLRVEAVMTGGRWCRRKVSEGA